MFNAALFPLCVMEPIFSTLDTTVICISAPTQSYDRHWWFMVNQPIPFVRNCRSVSTSPSPILFLLHQNFSRDHALHTCQATLPSCRSSLLFCFLGLPRFLFTVVLSELFPRPCSAHMSRNSSLLPKLASACFLGLSRFLFTAVLFPRLCPAVTIGN